MDEVNLKDQYYNADLFIFPSMEEGFGFPPLDAMNFNIPVISSRTGALPEILKDASYYVDHDDPTSIADAIIKVLGDNTLMVDLIQKGTNLVKTYTWENTAEKTYQLYRSLL
ncbi:glycosyltransferase [bacterium]|nr:glycosyltransferase [bacterium]